MKLSFKILVTVAAVLTGLLDLVVVIRLYVHGYPKYVVIDDGAVTAYRISFTSADWLILLAIVSLQSGLFYLLWKSWHSEAK